MYVNLIVEAGSGCNDIEDDDGSASANSNYYLAFVDSHTGVFNFCTLAKEKFNIADCGTGGSYI